MTNVVDFISKSKLSKLGLKSQLGIISKINDAAEDIIVSLLSASGNEEKLIYDKELVDEIIGRLRACIMAHFETEV